MRATAGRSLRPRTRVATVAALLLGGVGASVLGPATPAVAQPVVTLYVAATGTGTSCTQVDPCPTIQDAVNVAESSDHGSDVTVEVAGGTYTEDDTIDASSVDSLVVNGAGASATVVHGSFTVNSGSVGINDLAISDTTHQSAITIDGGTVSVASDTFSDDRAPFGGAIFVGGGTKLDATDDTFSDDGATTAGGGIYSYGGALTVSGDTFSGDHAHYGAGISNQHGPLSVTGATFSTGSATNGGGIYNENGALSVASSTFDANTAAFGGAIVGSGGRVELGNVTLFQNTAHQGGGGIYSYDAPTSIVDVTFSGDRSPDGAIVAQGGKTTLADSILQEDPSCYDYGSISDGGHNVESDNTCHLGPTSLVDNHHIDLAPSLAPNGSSGPETLAIDPTSSALNLVPHAACTIATDERGQPRPGISGHVRCDAGAYELQHVPGTLTQGPPTSGTATRGVKFRSQLTVTSPPAETGAVTYAVTSGASPVTVSPRGAVGAPASTAVGTYRLSGTDRDALGDRGQWSFALVVSEPTVTSLIANWNPALVGQPVLYTVTVKPATVDAKTGSPGPVTGFVTITGCGRRPLANGQATCTRSYAAVGQRTIVANFPGSATGSPSRATLAERVKENSITTVRIVPAQPRAGTPVSIVATVVSARARTTAIPTRGVAFFIDNQLTPYCQGVPLRGAHPDTATCVASFAKAGTYGLRVHYNGDGTFNPSEVVQTVHVK